MDVAVNAEQHVDEIDHVDRLGQDEVENTAVITNSLVKGLITAGYCWRFGLWCPCMQEYFMDFVNTVFKSTRSI